MLLLTIYYVQQLCICDSKTRVNAAFRAVWDLEKSSVLHREQRMDG